MIVSFVNTKKGHAAQTSNMLAVAAMMAFEEKKKVLMIHTGIKSESLERALLGRKVVEMGIDELKRAFMQKKLSETEMLSYCNTFLDEKLFLLAGTKAENEAVFEEIMCELFTVLLPNLQKYFDYIFVDVERCEGEMAERLMNMSQRIVVSTSQEPENLKRAAEQKNAFCILGRYDKKSCFDYGYVRRNHMGGTGKRLGTIAYCSSYMDAMFKGKVEDFFKININVPAKDINYEFIKSVRRTKNKLLAVLKDGEDEKGKRS